MCEYCEYQKLLKSNCEHQKLLKSNDYTFGKVEISEDIAIINDELLSISTIEQDYEVTRWSKKINYCPMCGRKLEE